MSSESADLRIAYMIVFGLLLAVVAAVMIALAWPSPAPEVCGGYLEPKCESGGSKAVVVIGFAVALAAQIMLAIGTIGVGVKYGTAAALDRAGDPF